MGKRKRLQSSSKIWPEDHKIALLCWLDYSLDHPGLDFKLMIVARLDNEYTLQQIDAKLKRLWRTKGPYPKKGVNCPDDIYKLGSRCLEYLTDAEMAALATLRETIDIGLSTEETPLTTPNRKLRSASMVEACAKSQNSRFATPKARDGRLPQNGWLQVPNTPPTTEKGPKENEGGGQSPKKKLKTYAKRQSYPTRKKSLGASPSAEPQPGSKKGTQSQSPTIINDSADEGPDSTEEIENKDTRVDVKQLPYGDGESQRAACEDKVDRKRERGEDGHSICHVCGGKSTSGPLIVPRATPMVNNGTRTHCEELRDRKIATAKSKIDEMRRLIVEKDMHLEDYRQEVQDKNRELAQLRVTRAQVLDDHKRPVENVIVDLKAKIHRLEAEIEVKSNLSIFNKLRSRSRDRFGESQIDQGFADIYFQSKQIICRQDRKTLPCVPLLDEFQDLRHLVERISAPSPDGGTLTNDMMSCLAQASPQAAIRALAASALREWIFMTRYPEFEENDSKLLQGYRSSIAKQGGSLALRNVDLGVLDSLIKYKPFREVTIPEKAEAMAIRLTQVLAPLFSDTPGVLEEEFDGFATWRHDEDECKERRRRLIDLFTTALKLKADSCLNLEAYEMVVFPPGAKYDPLTMIVETMEGMVEVFGKHDGGRVLLCVNAAVFAYARELQEGSSVSDAVVSTQNFVTREDGKRGKVRPLVRAVVILS